MQVLKEIMESVVGLGYVMQCVSCVCVTVCMYNANIYNNIHVYGPYGYMGINMWYVYAYVSTYIYMGAYGYIIVLFDLVPACVCIQDFRQWSRPTIHKHIRWHLEDLRMCGFFLWPLRLMDKHIQSWHALHDDMHVFSWKHVLCHQMSVDIII